MASLSITIGNEVYVYMNGKLTMKKWLNNQQSSVVFDVMSYDKHTLASITDDKQQ